MLRFHLDEHVPHAVAAGLRARRVDVTTTVDAKLLGADDDAHIEFARGEQRVVFTNDADFLRLASQGIKHSGIVYCPPTDSRIGEVVRYLALMSDCLEPNDIADKVEYL